jgi:molecular chaperone DnaJ
MGLRKFPDHYHALGISQSSTADEIKKAYKRLALQHHPDKKEPGDTDASQILKVISSALP